MGIGALDIFLLLISIIIIFFWYKEFVFMMALEDSDYPGKKDKILWFIVFFVFPFLAPFLFRTWKKAIKILRE